MPKLAHRRLLLSIVCTVVAAAPPALAEDAFIVSAEGGSTIASPPRGAMQLRIGWGGREATPVMFGVSAVSLTRFTAGTELALNARLATSGFVFGGWGGAIELGPYMALASPQSVGGLGEVILGGPWGLQISILAELGTEDRRTIGVVGGVDGYRFLAWALRGFRFGD